MLAEGSHTQVLIKAESLLTSLPWSTHISQQYQPTSILDPSTEKTLKGRKNPFQIINYEGYLKVSDEFNCYLPGKRY